METIIDNSAFRMITDYYNKSSHPMEVIWINEFFTKEQILVLSTLQGDTVNQSICQLLYICVISVLGQCKKDRYNDILKKIVDQQLTPFVKLENIVRNSEFFSKSFSCERDPKYFTQFPYFRHFQPENPRN